MVSNRTITSLYLPRGTALSKWRTKWDDKGSNVQLRMESRQRRPTAKGIMSWEMRLLVPRLPASDAHWIYPVLYFKQRILCSPFFMQHFCPQLQFFHCSCYIPAVNTHFTHFAYHPSQGQFDILPSRAAPQVIYQRITFGTAKMFAQ